MTNRGTEKEVALDRMRGAAFDAYERLMIAWPQCDPKTFYAPLAETLTWVTAIADGMGLLQDPLFSGLAYARNCTLHGRAVVAYMSIEGPGERKVLKGENRWGGGLATVYVWGFTDDPEPHDFNSGRAEKNRDRRAAYNENVAGYSVESRVPRALNDVGVNFWDAKPRWRRPGAAEPRKIIPPGWFPGQPDSGES